MVEVFQLIVGALASRFKSRVRLEAENLTLRQQVYVLCRQDTVETDQPGVNCSARWRAQQTPFDHLVGAFFGPIR
jgi:hypothetical protein